MTDLLIAANYKVNPNIWGGMDEFFLEISKRFRLEGKKLHIVVPELSDTEISHYQKLNIPHKVLEGEYFFSELIKYCHHNPSKIIHSHFLPTFARQFAKLKSPNTIVITTEHMSRPYAGWNWKKRFKSQINFLASHQSINKMIHVSKYLESENRLTFGDIVLDKSSVIYNGVRIKKLQSRDIKTFGKNQKIKLVSVGRLVVEKGFSELISVMHLLYAQYGDIFELNILGDGPLRKYLENEAGTLINKNIFFRGYVNNVSEWLRMSDLYVHCARQEAFAFVFLEAFEAGLPVVTYDIGGNREVLIDGFNGFLIDKKNSPDYFMRKIAFYFENPDKLFLHGSNGRLLIESSFSLTKMVDSYMELYKQFLQKV